MGDLDARIRWWITEGSDCEDPATGWDKATAALLAVLDLHAAPERALPGELHCGELIDWVQGGCPTVRAIAKALGIEAPGG